MSSMPKHGNKIRITVIGELEEDPKDWGVDTIHEVALKQLEWIENGESELSMVLSGAPWLEIKVEGIE